MHNRTLRTASVALLALSTAAYGGGTSHWAQTSAADFKKGTFRNVVATNLGDLKLSRATKRLLEQDPKVSAVYCLAEMPDGTVYAGTGPQGVLLRVKGDAVETAATLDGDVNITALAVDAQGRLLIGASGEKGRVLRLEKDGEPPREIFAAEGVHYVWAIESAADGTAYAATGPEGQLFQINADGSNKVLFDSEDNNLLSLAFDAKETLYAGSDPNGIVYKVDCRTGEHFVLYDAAESEVSCLALDRAGNLYAGTGDATAGVTGGETVAADQTGRPEGRGGGSPLPTAPPGDPVPPDPKPPGVPEPQPRAAGGEPDRSWEKLLSKGPAAPAAKSPARQSAATPLDEDDNPALPGAPADGDDAAPAPAATTTPAGGASVGAASGGGDGEDDETPSTGNAIYRIDPAGFVTEVFRQPVLVLSVVERDGTLLVGTGNEGFVYEVNPAADETVVVAKVDPKQVLSLLPAKDGRIFLGLANVGGVATMSSGFAADGTYTSEAFDAAQISLFGNLQLQGTLPPGTGVTVATRSGNVKDPEAGGWSKWSPEVAAAEFVRGAAPPARFFQYRLTLRSEAGKQTPAVSDVSAAYAVPNLPPIVKSVKVAAKADEAAQGESTDAAATAAKPPGGRMQEITWEASDPNADAMQYAVYARPLGTAGPWVLIKEKLNEATFTWDTKTAADGRYELRVVASDALANPEGQGKTAARVSDPVLVDNAPPTVSDVRTTVNGRDVRVEFRATDRNGIVAGAEYAVDSSQDWQAVAASDKLYDSPDEAASFVARGLTPGAHVIAVRASDPKGNQGYVNVPVTIEAPAER